VGAGFLGGKCIVNGCIPAKAMIYATKLYKDTLNAYRFGISIKKVDVRFKKIMKYIHELINDAIDANERELAQFDNIDFVRKNGRCINGHSVKVDNEIYNGKNLLIATGTKPWIPPIEGIENINYLTHETIFDLKELPKSIAFVGGGFISLEFANAFNTLGSQVYIIDTNDRPIYGADETISTAIKQYYEEDGINFISKSRTSKISSSSGKCLIETNNGHKIETEKVMIATGFRANTEGLDLEAAGVETDNNGNIIVDEYLKTTNPNIYAIGDILGKTQFTHMALRESKLVIHNIFNEKKIPINFENVPYAVFTNPPIGSIGETEQELKKKKISYKTAITEFSESSRGNLMKLKRGILKLIYDNNKIFGCHIIGDSTDILIHEIVPLIKLKNGLNIFKDLVHAHPTLSELFRNIQIQIS